MKLSKLTRVKFRQTLSSDTPIIFYKMRNDKIIRSITYNIYSNKIKIT